MISLYLKDLVEPYLNDFLTNEFVKAVFTEYDVKYKPIEVTIINDKIRVVKNILLDCIYYIISVYLPNLISLILALIRIFFVSIKLGILAFIGIVALCILFYYLPIPEPYIEDRENLLEILEDTFTNIEYIKTSLFGEERAINDIKLKSNNYTNTKMSHINRITLNQTIIFIFSLFLFFTYIIYLYILLKRGEVSIRDFESTILMVGQMFNLIFDIGEKIPDCVGDYQNLIELEKFSKKLFSYKDKNTTDKNIDVNSSMVEFKNVTFAFDNNILLDNFSVVLEHNKLIALYGPSGSGKSTFIKLIIDMYQPSKGELFIDNHSLTLLSKKKIRNYISYTSQNTTSLLKMTVYDNIIYGVGGKDEDLKNRVNTMVKKYEIDTIFKNKDFLEMMVEKVGSSLSGGQKQVIHLMHSLLNCNSKIIVLDEPTSALDQVTKVKIVRLIKSARDEGKSVFIITHDPEMRDMCDQVLTFTAERNPVLT